jgi:hypothetical protein
MSFEYSLINLNTPESNTQLIILLDICKKIDKHIIKNREMWKIRKEVKIYYDNLIQIYSTFHEIQYSKWCDLKAANL